LGTASQLLWEAWECDWATAWAWLSAAWACAWAMAWASVSAAEGYELATACRWDRYAAYALARALRSHVGWRWAADWWWARGLQLAVDWG
jgi:hypothetical protein